MSRAFKRFPFAHNTSIYVPELNFKNKYRYSVFQITCFVMGMYFKGPKNDKIFVLAIGMFHYYNCMLFVNFSVLSPFSHTIIYLCQGIIVFYMRNLQVPYTYTVNSVKGSTMIAQNFLFPRQFVLQILYQFWNSGFQVFIEGLLVHTIAWLGWSKEIPIFYPRTI